jgi:hypothetical protein
MSPTEVKVTLIPPPGKAIKVKRTRTRWCTLSRRSTMICYFLADHPGYDCNIHFDSSDVHVCFPTVPSTERFSFC